MEGRRRFVSHKDLPVQVEWLFERREVRWPDTCVSCAKGPQFPFPDHQDCISNVPQQRIEKTSQAGCMIFGRCRFVDHGLFTSAK
jgi:hypothetical protein